MRRVRTAGIGAALMGVALAGAACSRPAPSASVAPLQPAAAPGAAPAPPLQPVNRALTPAGPTTGGYSCSFPRAGRQTILARFTLDGAGAHDDEGTPFHVIANSPTALVLARARDDAAAGPGGDLVTYTVAIDRRDLSMVQSTVSLRGPAATRRGRCIAG